MDSIAFRQSLDQPRPPQQFQIIETLVPGISPRFGTLTARVSSHPRPSRLYPMRFGIPASQAIHAASRAFCSRIAQSNGGAAQDPAPTRRLRVIQNHFVGERFALIKIRHPRLGQDGNMRFRESARITSRAGSDITASPTQLVARIRMFENSTVCYCTAIVTVLEVTPPMLRTDGHGIAAGCGCGHLNIHLIQTDVTGCES